MAKRDSMDYATLGGILLAVGVALAAMSPLLLFVYIVAYAVVK